MSNRAVFAKGHRKDGPPPATVEQHCVDVLDAATVTWDAIEAALSQATSVPRAELRANVRPLLLVAAVLHDFMKANSAFQEMLAAPFGKAKTQPVRHEVLAAALLMQHTELRIWLLKLVPEEQLLTIAWAIGGHHFQMKKPRQSDTESRMFRDRGTPDRVSLYLDHQQIQSLFVRVAELLSHSESKPLQLTSPKPYDTLDDSPDGLEAMVNDLVRESDRLWKQIQKRESFFDFQRNLAIVKVCLVACDIAGSALPGSGDIADTPDDWIRSQLANVLSAADLDAIVKHNLRGRQPRRFQELVADSRETVTVVAAGCGNGKTTAAYMWAKRHAVGRKLFFTYPTTGTASAGFKGYLFAQNQLERDLIHGRAAVDLQTMAESADISPIERAQRLESLNAWGQQVIACTADTVLGLIQNQRRPVFSFPAIVSGAFVFDEVHSYDSKMFSALLRFLRAFPGLPVLIMSASIPPARLKKLQEAAPARISLQPITGDETLEKVERYTLAFTEEQDCWSIVERQLSASTAPNSQKFLWVCNTVNQAVETWRMAKEKHPDATVLLYHSRYRYRDRVHLQDAVIDEFAYVDDKTSIRKHQRPAIAITTQVCEMSLDISADILISALCPLPSLVQRLGRLNRYTEVDDPKPAHVFPFSGRPYHEDDAPMHMEAAQTAIERLLGVNVTQHMLAVKVAELQSNENLPEYSAWLDGGWQSEPLPLRDGDNGITIVRQDDLEELATDKYGRYDKKDVVPITIPMLYKKGFNFEVRAAGYPVARMSSESEWIVEYRWNEETKQGEGASWQRRSQ